MDDGQFDTLARSFAAGRDRRSFVGAMVAGLGGALSLAVGPSAGAARKRHGKAKHRQVTNEAKGPDPCAVFCADEHGARGAQCRQACKACGAAACLRFDEASGSFRCCGDNAACVNGSCACTFATCPAADDSTVCCANELHICGAPRALPDEACCFPPGALISSCFPEGLQCCTGSCGCNGGVCTCGE
jgi:hypothetical protein